MHLYSFVTEPLSWCVIKFNLLGPARQSDYRLQPSIWSARPQSLSLHLLSGLLLQNWWSPQNPKTDTHLTEHSQCLENWCQESPLLIPRMEFPLVVTSFWWDFASWFSKAKILTNNSRVTSLISASSLIYGHLTPSSLKIQYQIENVYKPDLVIFYFMCPFLLLVLIHCQIPYIPSW